MWCNYLQKKFVNDIITLSSILLSIVLDELPKSKRRVYWSQAPRKKRKTSEIVTDFCGEWKDIWWFDQSCTKRTDKWKPIDWNLRISSQCNGWSDEVKYECDGRQTRKSQKIHRQSPSTRSPRSCPRRPRWVVEKFVK